MEALLILALVGTFVAISVDLLQRLPTEPQRQFRNWLIQWFIKGAAVPCLVWILFNAGVFDNLPNFVSPRMLQRMGSTGAAASLMVYAGLLVITSYWCAATSGWMLVMISPYVRDRRKLVEEVRWMSIVAIPIAALILVAFSWGALGVAASLCLMPLLKAAANHTNEPMKRRPTYSRANVHLQRGQYEAAEEAVIGELEKCDDDFDGWMLLADLYANHFHDLPAAARMIEETCDQPSTTVSEVAVAYHRLADWHLKLDNNPTAAVEALQRISQRHPGTHIDRMAQSRIRKLTGDKTEPVKPAEFRTIQLPSLDRELEVAVETSQPGDAVFEAQRCSEKLTKDPNDIAARERFAHLLAENLDQSDVAIEQLELLIDMSSEAAQAKMPEWLLLLATWQLKFRNDEAKACALMRRLIRDHPNTIHAFNAQRRLHLIEMENRLRSMRTPKPAA